MQQDTLLRPLLMDLKDCLCTQNTESKLPEPCFCGVLPGAEAALDYCGSGGCCTTKKNGQLWVRLDTAFPSTEFPEIDQERGCASPLAVVFEVGAMRCITPGGTRAQAPSEEQYERATDLQLADMAMMRRAIACCAADHDIEYLLGEYVPYGPQGGCVGGTWAVTMRKF